MVDKISSQSVDFKPDPDLGERTTQVQNDKPLMDKDTENALLDRTRNFNKMVNNMFNVCAKRCIKNFTNTSLNTQEAICVENCQKKYFTSYAVGHQFLDMIVNQVNKTDLFATTTDVDIIQRSVDNVNNQKI
jgi:hypothetical protein